MSKVNVLVAGDVVTDHHIYVGERAYPSHEGMGTQRRDTEGGARLLADLIRCAYPRRLGEVVEYVSPGDGDTAYAVWSPCASGNVHVKPRIWRVTRTLGYSPKPDWRDNRRPRAVRNDIDIVVLDDAGLGFRFARTTWPRRDVAREGA